MSDEKLPGSETQDQLFPVDPDWKDTWQGMPSYQHQDLNATQSVLVHFKTLEDREAFARLVAQRISSSTKSVWYPKVEIGTAADKIWTTNARTTPRYPIYIISKGRADSRLTSKAFEFAGVPYHIVIEPQEYDQYAAVIAPEKILTLPFSNLGLGGIPARNWVWDHATATGAARHWIFDDNISGFCRFHDNLKVEVDSGILHTLIEDWVDRYENVVMAGFNYDYFAPRKQAIRPIIFNTRVYSGILLSNQIVEADGTPMRWRGRYNEDTDLSLRILHDPQRCTALFNAFLMYKKPTLTMKGGNTDELYAGAEAMAAEWDAHVVTCGTCMQCADGYTSLRTPCAAGRLLLSKDGRWLMAESLRAQHPDVTTVERKWQRWQHQVDYRRFASNVLVLRPDAIIPTDEDRGLRLDKMPENTIASPQARLDVVAVAAAGGPSALDFAMEPEQPEEPVRACGIPAHVTTWTQPGSVSHQLPAGPAELPTLSEDAQLVKVSLEARGYRLLTSDGRLFITPTLGLTDEDRAAIKTHKAELLLGAERAPSSTSSAFPKTIAAVSFVGPGPRHDDWRPDVPPDLTGITQIVMNFATSGLRWDKGDRPIGVTVSTLDGGLSRFLPFGFAHGGNLDEAVVKRWAVEQLRGKKIINAKTKFDIHMAREWGVDLEAQGCTFSDIQHTAALLDDHRRRFALDILAADYLPDIHVAARLDETRHGDYHAREGAAREHCTVMLVAKLTAALQPEIDRQDLRAVHDLEDRVILPVVEMEKNGAPIDRALLAQQGQECRAAHEALMWEIAREGGFAFEHTAAGWTRLLEKLGLPVPEAFDEATLSEVDHPLVKKGQLASQYASLNSKIFKAYETQLDGDDILRFEINQLRGDDGGTVSGRFSIGYVQQVPNHDNHAAVFGETLFPRRLFVPRTGAYLAVDAAQIEYRLFAHYANNPKVLAAYKTDPWLSFHKMTWGMMKAYKADMLYAHQKSFNFARQYGAKSVKLATMMQFITAKAGEEIRRAKRWDDPRLTTIHEIEQAYTRMMPEGDLLLARAAHLAKPACDEFCKPHDKLHREQQHRGYVKTLLGRRSRFPNGYKTYIGLNRVLQGTGADILKQKLVELHATRKTTGFLLRMTVHDEIGGDAQGDETLSKVTEILNRQSFPLRVPILWDGKIGQTWADCK
jgi:DNA polymerase I-like protein with 3'-5' exonuclease and polymerase domains